MEPLETLFEHPGLPSMQLPGELEALYGGGLSLPSPVVYANFVTSLDGVVAIDRPGLSSGPAISGRSEADRFVMGLLRSLADAVLVGAGTMRADPGHLWTPGYIHPPSAPAFARLRERLGKRAEPLLAVLTGRGDVEPAEPALAAGALVLTTEAGAARLRGRLPAAAQVRVLPPAEFGPASALQLLRAEGCQAVLTEGGPTVMGQLLRERALDELFLTLSPVLAGRGSDRRLGLVEAQELLPERGAWSTLLSLRRHGSHLFLRYDLGPGPFSVCSRSGPEYTLKRPSRRKPTSVIPKRRAVATARLLGAPIATTTGMPAATAFCTIS
jgi:riboflavin biosynthesis pyrimidine reductase